MRVVQVFLDGENISGIEVKKSDSGLLYIEANLIFERLDNEVSFDAESNTLTVKRPQDHAVMELDIETGIVKANGKALGKLPKFGYIDDESFMLTVNAIAVLTGTKGKFNNKNNRLDFKLDPRLRVSTGFNVYINDIPSPDLNPPPQVSRACDVASVASYFGKVGSLRSSIGRRQCRRSTPRSR